MESVEVSAKSVEEAIQQALIRLGKNREEVDVTVLSEGHKGILGFVRGETARVRVTVRKPQPADTPRVSSQPADTPRVSSQPADTRRSSGQPAVQNRAEIPITPVPRVVGPAAVAQETMEELLEKMGIDADVVTRGGTGEDESPILLEVVGADLGILIGRRGETLASLQFLLNLMVGKRLDAWVRIIIDVEGYKARREESLRSIATRAAERVRRTGQPVTLEPMPPNERRIVHLALQDSPHVTTESSGYGEDRRVTVLPKSR